MFNNEQGTGRMVFPDFQAVYGFLMYSSLFLALIAGAMIYMSCVIQDLPLVPSAFGIMALMTYSVYNLNRKTDEKEDAINHSERYAFTKKYERFLFASALLTYLIAFFLAGIHGAAVLAITAIPLVSGIVYSMPVFPRQFGFRRLKEIPIIKSLIVATAWAIPAALLPAYVLSAAPGISTVIIGLFIFSLAFVNTVVFDMRDVAGDIVSGVRTIPVLLGVARTKILLTLVNLLFGTIAVLFGLAVLSFAEICILIVAIAYVQWYIVYFQQIAVTGVLCDLIVDGQFIVFGGLVYAATNF